MTSMYNVFHHGRQGFSKQLCFKSVVGTVGAEIFFVRYNINIFPNQNITTKSLLLPLKSQNLKCLEHLLEAVINRKCGNKMDMA